MTRPTGMAVSGTNMRLKLWKYATRANGPCVSCNECSQKYLKHWAYQPFGLQCNSCSQGDRLADLNVPASSIHFLVESNYCQV